MTPQSLRCGARTYPMFRGHNCHNVLDISPLGVMTSMPKTLEKRGGSGFDNKGRFLVARSGMGAEAQ